MEKSSIIIPKYYKGKSLITKKQMVKAKNDENRKRRPINISNEAYLKSREIAERLQYSTLVEYVNETLLRHAAQENFLRMYAPYIKQDYVSEDAVYLKDSKINKIAIVRLKEYDDEDLENSGYYLYCETCSSDSCIHVRQALASGSTYRLKLSNTQV